VASYAALAHLYGARNHAPYLLIGNLWCISSYIQSTFSFTSVMCLN